MAARARSTASRLTSTRELESSVQKQINTSSRLAESPAPTTCTVSGSKVQPDIERFLITLINLHGDPLDAFIRTRPLLERLSLETCPRLIEHASGMKFLVETS